MSSGVRGCAARSGVQAYTKPLLKLIKDREIDRSFVVTQPTDLEDAPALQQSATIIASLVNIFLKSSGLDWALLVIGVLIFAGLTAWDTQKIKEYYDPQDDGTIAGRKAIMGALSLYLDFINMFMMLLRLFGDRR
jgi:hypothetical protein